MQVSFLHTNDLHGALSSERLPFLVAERSRADLYFDTGDCIRTGNLGLPLKPEPVWELLHEADCSASVIGNRETHLLESAFRAKLTGASHPVLCGNLRKKDGTRPLTGQLLLEVKGVRVGVLGVSVAMVTERMRTQAASAYLWDPPIATALELAKSLRSQCDLLIALTHIGLTQDRSLAAAGSDIDLILGGHSHSVLAVPELVGSTWICQGGSHGKYLGRYTWTDGQLQGGLLTWPKAS